MGKHRVFNLTQKLRAAAAILMVSSLGLFYPGTVSNLHAQSPIKAKSSTPAGGPKEGIKVHGRWTIDIRNPDGKLVTHREFDNALEPTGAASLGHFLQRTFKAGEWQLIFGDVSASDPPCMSATNQLSNCVIYEPATQWTASDTSAPNAFKSLTVASQGGSNNNTVLAGTATAQRDGRIRVLSTYLFRCSVDTPGVCTPTNSRIPLTFTSATLATPINVVAGQIIQVTVVISFS